MEQNTVETPTLLNALAWADKNRKQLIYAVAGLGVVGLVIGYMTWARGEKEEAAGKDLSQAIYNQMGRGDFGTAADSLLKVAANYNGTPAGAQALLLAANSQFNAGKFADAQATFERFRKDYPGDALVAQAIYGAGIALAAQGKGDEATRLYKEAVDLHPKAPVAKQAKFALASAYEAQGKADQALTLYQDILRDGMGGSLVNEAAQRAEALHAKLTPPPSPSAGAVTNLAPTP
jgi:outer membrane protein assembly factor BamD (BamD/ComL family)